MYMYALSHTHTGVAAGSQRSRQELAPHMSSMIVCVTLKFVYTFTITSAFTPAIYKYMLTDLFIFST